MISAGTDCFGILPAEIRTEILRYVRTADMFNARLSSRAMAAVFYDQTFWKSRFQIDGDRGYLAYLLCDANYNRMRGKKLDWRFLYHVTNQFKSEDYDNNGISQRERVWVKNRWISQVASIARRPTISFTNASGAELKLTQNLTWKALGANNKRLNDRYWLLFSPEFSPNRIFSQSAYIPQSVRAIAVSVLQQMDMTYITGLEFICENHGNITFGYKLPESRVEEYVTGLKGFTTAVSSAGVCALQPITHSHTGKWLGLPSDGHYSITKEPYLRAFISKRLIFETNIEAIRCTFDVS